MNSLKEVQKFLNKIPNINHGGCGLSALAMHKWLKEYKEIDSKFIFLYGNDIVGRIISKINYFCVQEGNFKDSDGPYHVMLKVKDKIIDSAGEDNINSYELVQDLDINEETMIKFLNNFKVSSQFDWKKWIPIIEFELDIQLNDLRLQ